VPRSLWCNDRACRRFRASFQSRRVCFVLFVFNVTSIICSQRSLPIFQTNVSENFRTTPRRRRGGAAAPSFQNCNRITQYFHTIFSHNSLTQFSHNSHTIVTQFSHNSHTIPTRFSHDSHTILRIRESFPLDDIC